MRSLKRLLREQEYVAGMIVDQTIRPWVAKVYADAGADFVFIESEHMLFNNAELSDFILASRLCDLPVVAKCSYVNRGSITRLLDAGATGIQLPMSESADQLHEVVSYVKYPPVGVRAAAPGYGNTDYRDVDPAAWLREANEESLVLAHIETCRGVEAVDDILSVPGVDMMFIGTYDLSVSCGYPAQFEHPEVAKAIARLIDAAKAHGVTAGMWAPSHAIAMHWLARGVRFFELTGEVDLIRQAAFDLMRQFEDRKH